MKHGFIKLGAAVPPTHVAAPMKNAAQICRLIDRAYGEGVHVLVFPELSLTGYTCGDLFRSDDLLNGAEKALLTVAEHTAGKKMLVSPSMDVIRKPGTGSVIQTGIKQCQRNSSKSSVVGIDQSAFFMCAASSASWRTIRLSLSLYLVGLSAEPKR